MARITSKDVAREAGVSQTTVSFVLNDRPDQTIPAHTRTAVLDAAKRLGYVPSAAARSLKRGHSNVILCVLPDVPVSESFEEFKRNLSTALGESNYTCVYLHAERSDTPLASLWQHVHPSVVAAFGTLSESDAEPIRRAGIALIEDIFEPSKSSITGLNQREVGRLQGQHLFDKGHQRLGFGAVADVREDAFCLPRLRGLEDFCLEHALEAPAVEYLDYTTATALTALERWTAESIGVTAVAAFNDLSALSVLSACRDSGVSVPQQLAVIGVDDLPASALSAPALTTVAMDLTVPAHVLAAHILKAAGAPSRPSADGGNSPIFTLVQRDTT